MAVQYIPNFTCQACGPICPDVVKKKCSIGLAEHGKAGEQSVGLKEHPRNSSVERLALVQLRHTHSCPGTCKFLHT
jgi:hypothetical protein